MRDSKYRPLRAGLLALAFFLVTDLALTVGCNAPQTPEQAEQQKAERAEAGRLEKQQKFVATLPKGATDVRDAGGDNVTFTLALDGQTHRYWAYYYRRGYTYDCTITRID